MSTKLRKSLTGFLVALAMLLGAMGVTAGPASADAWGSHTSTYHCAGYQQPPGQLRSYVVQYVTVKYSMVIPSSISIDSVQTVITINGIQYPPTLFTVTAKYNQNTVYRYTVFDQASNGTTLAPIFYYNQQFEPGQSSNPQHVYVSTWWTSFGFNNCQGDYWA